MYERVYQVVLNPHGSDETCLTMKQSRHFTMFLTHTVQMKHTKKFLVIVVHDNVLNPHGSDETELKKGGIKW